MQQVIDYYHHPDSPQRLWGAMSPLLGSLWVLRKCSQMGSSSQGEWQTNGRAHGTSGTHTSLSASSPPTHSITIRMVVTLHIRAITGGNVLFHSIGHTFRSQFLTVRVHYSHWPDSVCHTCWGGWRESLERAVGCPRDVLTAPREFQSPPSPIKVPCRSSRTQNWYCWYRVGWEKVEGCLLQLLLTLALPSQRMFGHGYWYTDIYPQASQANSWQILSKLSARFQAEPDKASQHWKAIKSKINLYTIILFLPMQGMFLVQQA